MMAFPKSMESHNLFMFQTTNQKSWPYQNTTTTTGHPRMGSKSCAKSPRNIQSMVEGRVEALRHQLFWAKDINHVAGNVCMLHAIEHETTVVTTSHEFAKVMELSSRSMAQAMQNKKPSVSYSTA